MVDKVRQHGIVGHLKAYFKDTAIATIGPAESRAYADARRAGVIGGGKRRKSKVGGDATIRRELNCLIAAFNHAVRWGRLTGTPISASGKAIARIELPTEPRGGEVKWLTKEEVKKALDAASGHLRAFIEIAYYTAGRRHSIETLTKFQVDLAQGRINLMPAGAVATKKRKPIVPIYPEIRPTVERLMAEATGAFLFGAADVDFYRPFCELMMSLNILAHPHMLRHSRASHMLMDGESIWKVAKLLGDTVATVEKTYGHVNPEFLATESNVESEMMK